MSNRETDWALLAKGKTVGKRVNLAVNILTNGKLNPNAKTNAIEIGRRGDQGDPLNLCITIVPPKVVWVSGTNIDGTVTQTLADQAIQGQQVSGVTGNGQSRTATRQWHNLLAVLEWGVGGISVEGVEVDVRNGCALNIIADYARLYFKVDDSCVISYSPGNALYECGAFIGPGRPVGNPRRTIVYGSVLPASVTS